MVLDMALILGSGFKVPGLGCRWGPRASGFQAPGLGVLELNLESRGFGRSGDVIV